MKTTCPCCGLIANSKSEIESQFGFRKMNGTLRPQSWCRKCRSHGPLDFHEHCPYK